MVTRGQWPHRLASVWASHWSHLFTACHLSKLVTLGTIDAMELNPDGLGWYYGSANLVTEGHSLSHWSHLVTVCHIGHILYQNRTQ